MKRIILWILGAGVIGAVAAYLYVFQIGAKHSDPLKADNSIKITAIELFDVYEKHEDSANALYNGKTIFVKGEVDNISFDAPRYTINLKTNGEMGVVMCEMDTNNNATVKLIKSGEEVEIAGFCNGINMDVYLDRCKLAK